MTRGALAVIAALALLASGCSNASSTDGSGEGGKGDGRSLTFALTDEGCEPAAATITSGPVTFDVENKGASAVTELEILEGARILGEIENLAEGFRGDFTLTLQPGRYELYCPNGDSAERGVLTVTGSKVVSKDSALAATAVEKYRQYVIAQTKLLVARSTEFTDAVRAGDRKAAMRLFPTAREPYQRVEPVAESFGSIDPEIDARAGDVPAAAWTGFHRLEKMLWVDRSGAEAMTGLTDELDVDIARLARLVTTADYQPAQIANGAKELMDEIGASKVTGEEDRYSHTDLYDFHANVEGARAVFDSLRPLLATRAPSVVTAIEKEFESLDSTLEPYRRGAGWVTYTEVTPEQRRELTRAVDALAESLSKMAAIVAQ